MLLPYNEGFFTIFMVLLLTSTAMTDMLRGLSPQVNYSDRVTDVRSVQWIPMAVFSVF
jgi:hypothetical protein